MNLSRRTLERWRSVTLAGTLGLLLATTAKAAETSPATETTIGLTDANPLLAQSGAPLAQMPTVTILSPTPNQVLDRPAATIMLQFPATDSQGNPLQLELTVNGKGVDPALIGRTETDLSTKQVNQTWYGVVLAPGDNTIVARLVGPNGPGPETTIPVQVRGVPKEMRIRTLESRIPADGRSTATVQGEVLDENGNRSNWDTVVTLTANAGEWMGADYDRDQPGFQIKVQQGQFMATLRSAIEAQTVQIRAVAGEIEGFTQLQLTTNLRPSLVTGVVDFRVGGRGLDFYRSFRDFLPPDGDTSTRVDLRTAVFGTGRIGEWLFTGAYNSDRPLNQTCDRNSLFRDIQFCEKNYPVYGDSSTASVTTPSIDSVYLRFQRSPDILNAAPDYFMWGDYNTEEFATRSQQFTATTRQFHGFKTNYNLGDLQLTALYADNVKGFQRDVIPPDGTSGYYFLSRRLLLAGSENVFLETEELNRPGTVIQRTALQRGPDYEIDYDRGTLLFRRPVLQTELDRNGQVLVRRIVVTYQYESQNTSNSAYAGRARYHFSRLSGQESWVAATYLKENQGVRNFELYGADALISFGAGTQLIAEYARSNNTSELLNLVGGSAYRLDFNAQIQPGLVSQSYYRATDTGFANNATTSFVPGQTRYGTLLSGQISPTTIARFQYDHEDNYGIAPRVLTAIGDLLTPRQTALPGSRVDNSLSTISVGVQQQLGQAALAIDYIHRDRQDRILSSPLNSSSDQLRSRLTMPLLDTLTFLVQNETTLAGSDPIYTDRTVLALNWAAYPGINIRLGQQFFTKGPLAGNSITSLDVLGDYALGSDTSLTARYSILTGINGITNQGAIGLNQRWVISSGLRMNLAYERIFGSYYQPTAASTQFPQPLTVGQSAAALGLLSGDSYSVGLEYSDSPAFQASARYEYRTSSAGNNTTITAAATGKILPELTVLMRYQQANAANQLLTGLGDSSTLRLGLAYRDPKNDNFNALLRYDYRRNPSTIPTTILLGSGTGSEDHTFAAEAIYAPDWQWELYGKFALRNSTTYLANNLAGTSTISLSQLRATYRMGYNMDLVGEVRWIGQPVSGYSEAGYVVEAGYYLTPNLRASVGYSSGNVIAGDLVGSRSASGFYGGLTIKLNELFDGFGLQKPLPPQQQESRVTPTAAAPPTSVRANLPELLRLDLLKTLNFQPEQASVTDAAGEVLNHLAVVLRESPALTVEMQGYLASLMTNVADPDLDAQRALLARTYLLNQGVPSNQMILRSLGQRPTGAQSRSVELTLTGTPQAFGLLATRLRKSGVTSPVLETLQSMVGDQANAPDLAATPTDQSVALAQSVNFMMDASPSAEGQSVLDRVLGTLKNQPDTVLELQGYVTASATSTDLAMERVMVIRNYLLDQGINADRIVIRSLSPATVSPGASTPMAADRVDLVLSQKPADPKTAAETERLVTALNALLGQDTAAAAAILRAMGIRQPEVQGVVIDPALLDSQGRSAQ